MNIFQKQLDLSKGNQNSLAVKEGWQETENEPPQRISVEKFLRQTDKCYYAKDGEMFIRNTQ